MTGDDQDTAAASPGRVEIKRSLAWMAAAQAIAFVLQFAASVVLARYLSPHDAGIYAAALAVAGMLSLVQTLGLQALIVREDVLDAPLVATTFTINTAVALLLAGAIFAGGLWGGSWLGDPGVARVLSALAVTPLLAIPAFLPAAMLEREGRFREIALVGTAGSVTAALATIALLVGGFGYMSAAYAQWAGGAVTAALMLRAGRRHVAWRVSIASWRRVAGFAFQMLAVSGINMAALRLSDLALARLRGLSALGLFSRATSINGLLWNNIHLLIGRVMLVDFAELHRRGEPLRERYLRTVEIVTALLWPTFVGVAVLAKPFIGLIYGPAWLGAAMALALLALASAIQVAITMTWEVFTATGELATQTRIEGVRSLFALATFVAGCLVSLEAAAAARVADALFALILYRPHLDRMTGTRGADLLPIYGRSIVLTLCACGPAAVLMAVWHWSAAVPLAGVAAAVASGCVLWVAGLALMRHPLAVELRRRGG